MTATVATDHTDLGGRARLLAALMALEHEEPSPDRPSTYLRLLRQVVGENARDHRLRLQAFRVLIAEGRSHLVLWTLIELMEKTLEDAQAGRSVDTSSLEDYRLLLVAGVEALDAVAATEHHPIRRCAVSLLRRAETEGVLGQAALEEYRSLIAAGVAALEAMGPTSREGGDVPAAS